MQVDENTAETLSEPVMDGELLCNFVCEMFTVQVHWASLKKLQGRISMEKNRTVWDKLLLRKCLVFVKWPMVFLFASS